MVDGGVGQGAAGDVGGAPPAGDDVLWVELHADQLLGLLEQLGGQHRHRGGAVAHLVVLHARHVHQHLGRRVVDADVLQDGGAVVGYLHFACLVTHQL